MIQTKIRDYLTKNILFVDSGFEYSDDDSFLEQGIIDSVGVMELVLFVEDSFNLVVDDHEVTPENFDSVNKLAYFIQGKQNRDAQPSLADQ